MTASSVTDVGHGSALGANKGAQERTLGVEHLLGIRLVDGGAVALTSGSPSTAEVKFGTALTSTSGFFVVAQPVGGTAAIAAGGVAVSALALTGFTLTGPNSVTTTMNWMLFKLF